MDPKKRAQRWLDPVSFLAMLRLLFPGGCGDFVSSPNLTKQNYLHHDGHC